MVIKVEYSTEEVEAILLNHHTKKFGTAPEGEHWDVGFASSYAGRRTIENVKNKTEEVAPPTPAPIEEL